MVIGWVPWDRERTVCRRDSWHRSGRAEYDQRLSCPSDPGKVPGLRPMAGIGLCRYDSKDRVRGPALIAPVQVPGLQDQSTRQVFPELVTYFAVTPGPYLALAAVEHLVSNFAIL